ncbi:MAG: DUF3738 domain-containing protein [Chitinophagaceae bacterium]|nr:DUF3738 domain-containing protein [Chitinophagaceae bacterium]
MKDFLKKPLLIVFWNSDCEVSNKFLTKLDSINLQMKNRMNVLVITGFSDRKIKDAFAYKTIIKNIQVPVVAGDTFFHKKFPHRFQPHVVWVNNFGIISGITGHEEVTTENLKLFISKATLNLPLKEDIMDPDILFSLTPLMVNEYQKNKNKLVVYSYIGGPRSGILSGSNKAIYNNIDSVLRINSRNADFKKLYYIAFDQYGAFHNNRYLIEGKGLLNDPRFNDLYCYDLILKDTSKKKIYRFMQQDLDRFFNITTSLETRPMEVLVLKRLTTTDKIAAKSNTPADSYATTDSLYWRNIRLYFFVEWLNEISAMPYPVIDETGYKGKADFSLPNQLKNWMQINKALNIHGLELVLETRPLEVIIFKD